MCQCSDAQFGQVHAQAVKFKAGLNKFLKNVKNSVSKVLTGRACLRLPPGFSENPCLGHATCVHRRGGDASIPLPVGKAGFPSYADASAANCSACPNVPGNVITGICNCNCNFDMNMSLKMWKILCQEF
jgi:hypothetical protein